MQTLAPLRMSLEALPHRLIYLPQEYLLFFMGIATLVRPFGKTQVLNEARALGECFEQAL